MLRSRIIPCLLIHNNGLVKSVNFKDYKYVGDPINAVRIFNEKCVDELMVLDIDASTKSYEPNYELISHLATECRMPLCYGGGIKTVDQAKKILALGVEKVALSSVMFENPGIAQELANQVGSQSVVIVLDVKKKRFSSEYDIYTHNCSKKTGRKLKEFIGQINHSNIGEFVINSIDKDGTMSGYDTDLANLTRGLTKLPITMLGGAGNMHDIAQLVNKHKIIGAAAGSLFVFKGKYRAVLINYLSEEQKETIC